MYSPTSLKTEKQYSISLQILLKTNESYVALWISTTAKYHLEVIYSEEVSSTFFRNVNVHLLPYMTS